MAIPADLAQTLAVVLDEGTLDGAARRLHVTPSAVSQRIRGLEQRLGQVLLIRSRPVRATPAGAAVVRLARQVTLLEHETAVALGIGGDGDAGERLRLPIAVNADSLASWFLDSLVDVVATLPVTVDLHRDDQDFTAELLESGTVMAAVTSRARAVAGCRVRPLGVMRYEAVAAAGYVARHFAQGIDADALGAAMVVDFDRKDDLQSRWLRTRGVDPARPPRHYVPASQDFAYAVRIGLGWGMLPTQQSATDLADGTLVRLGGDPIDVPLYWQQWNLRSSALDALADAVARTAAGALTPR